MYLTLPLSEYIHAHLCADLSVHGIPTFAVDSLSSCSMLVILGGSCVVVSRVTSYKSPNNMGYKYSYLSYNPSYSGDLSMPKLQFFGLCAGSSQLLGSNFSPFCGFSILKPRMPSNLAIKRAPFLVLGNFIRSLGLQKGTTGHPRNTLH